MKVALAQINTTIGNFPQNVKRIIDFTNRAKQQNAQIVVFPELCLCGYPPMDLLDYPAFCDANQQALSSLQKQLSSDIAVLVGYVRKHKASTGKSLQNAVSIILNGNILMTQAKSLLPTYDVFDEARYFEPGQEFQCQNIAGIRIGIAICEDIWAKSINMKYACDPITNLVDAGAEIILVPSASPFVAGKFHDRKELVKTITLEHATPVIYVNLVGGNDSLIFDGYSMAVAKNGELCHLSSGFQEELAVIDTKQLMSPSHKNIIYTASKYTDIENALITGVRDYLHKTGFSQVHLGLSGGIDSAVAACIAARAIGAEHVTGILMPSQYSSAGSIQDAQKLSRNLGIHHIILPIHTLYDTFLSSLQAFFTNTKPNTTEENIQARIRGTLLMAWSNKFHSLTICTGNKSELATGYCTLYGDMVGGLSIIGDLFKTEVYDLARHLNQNNTVIPAEIMDKPPSAELRPDQRDSDSLPDYELLDAILYRYLILNHSYNQIISDGFEPETTAKVLKLTADNEYKRLQSALVLKISARSFGSGRRIPVARTVYEIKNL